MAKPNTFWKKTTNTVQTHEFQMIVAELAAGEYALVERKPDELRLAD